MLPIETNTTIFHTATKINTHKTKHHVISKGKCLHHDYKANSMAIKSIQQLVTSTREVKRSIYILLPLKTKDQDSHFYTGINGI